MSRPGAVVLRRPPAHRLLSLLLAMGLALTAIVVRLVLIQRTRAPDGRALRTYGYDQRVQPIELPAWRGRILDRNGEPLAISLEARDIYADPRSVRDPFGTAERLAGVLGTSARELLPALLDDPDDPGDDTFAWVARHVDVATADRVRAMGLPGIGFLPSSRRSYPAGVAAQVVGFVGTDGEGLEGLEYRYDRLLAGRPGERIQETDPAGRPIAHGVSIVRPPVPGSDLVTTIDRALQFASEEACAEAVAANRARGGIVIVMRPSTGEVLAMAVCPSFDPDRFEDADPTRRRNRAVTDAFEPGSVNKVITASAAIEEGVVPLDREFVVPDEMRIGGFTIHDAHPHPPERMTIADIVARSSNIGAVEVADLLGEDRMAAYLARFGYGRPTGIGLPGESGGLVPPVEEWSATSLATMAYGQGLAVTPLQMAAVYATIANGGVWVRPRLVAGTVGPDGTYTPAPPSPTRRVVSERTAEIVTRMLAYAVDDGTGTLAQIPGFQVAGKTGTARKPFEDRPGYSDRHVASFIGFLPASRPEVVIAAILDEPETVYGGVAAAPLFQEVARYAIRHLGIAPGRPVPAPPHASELP
ncbi:MAG TPA: penicillin-binding protein 2 [Actinomycetota bacterium]|nr:penicillin-binding protein 2 [Actinomycetota bacterium]